MAEVLLQQEQPQFIKEFEEPQIAIAAATLGGRSLGDLNGYGPGFQPSEFVGERFPGAVHQVWAAPLALWEGID